MRYTIRPATPEDAPQLVALSQAVGSEPEGWLISAGGWRTVAEERRLRLAAVSKPPSGATPPTAKRWRLYLQVRAAWL